MSTTTDNPRRAQLLHCCSALLSRRRIRRRGVTILELLVVILILLMVTAAAIPIVAPALQNRQMRESARLVSSYLEAARSRAIEAGRPVGVVIERFNGQPFGMVLSQVEVPPPYGGDFADSRISINAMGQIDGFATGDVAWEGLIRYGDQIKFDFRGPSFYVMSVQSGVCPLVGTVAPDPGATPWYLQTADGSAVNLLQTYPNDVPFQIIRQPTRSFTAPLQLPEGIVVDLACSGVGAGGTFMSALSFGGAMTGAAPPYQPPIVPFDPVIMFSPSGRLESVSQVPTGALARPTGPVYLLIGKRELMFDATQQGANSDVVDQNLSPVAPGAMAADPTTWPAPPPHFWVSVGYQTGLVTVTEVARNFQDFTTGGRPLTAVITEALAFPFAPIPPDNLTGARHFARESQSVGGR